MKKTIVTALAASFIASTALPATKVALFFDTEDYTCDRSNDAIRDIAEILRSEGIKDKYLSERLRLQL